MHVAGHLVLQAVLRLRCAVPSMAGRFLCVQACVLFHVCRCEYMVARMYVL